MEFTVSRSDLVRELNLSQGVVEKKTTIPILSNVLVEADCPAGVPAVSGGFQTTTGPLPAGAVSTESSAGGGPVPGGTPSVGYWRVTAENNAGGAQTVTAHVYCMSGIKVPALRQDQGSATLPTFGSLSQSSSCPPAPKPKKPKKGKKKQPAKLLSAGGFASQATVPIEVFSESRIESGTWLNTGINVTGPSGAIHLTSQGICV